MKTLISQKLHVTPQELVLQPSSITYRNLKESDNGRTLAELEITSNENFIATKRSQAHIPRAPFLFRDGELTPETKRIFHRWFDAFSVDDRMTREQCAAFVTSCTDDHCTTHDKRVNEFFDRYDREGRGFVTRDDFIALYHGAARHKPQVVWSNIHASKYTNSLKSPEEVAGERTRSREDLPRYKIAHT